MARVIPYKDVTKTDLYADLIQTINEWNTLKNIDIPVALQKELATLIFDDVNNHFYAHLSEMSVFAVRNH